MNTIKADGTAGLGIYCHIPFCLKKCAYCDFSSFPAKVKKRSATTLGRCTKKSEISPEKMKIWLSRKWTPSILEAERLPQLMPGRSKKPCPC